MKPGDLVIAVLTEEEQRDADTVDVNEAEFYKGIGLHGIIVEPVTLEDGHPINSWCDWWVLIDGELQPWAKENLRVVDD